MPALNPPQRKAVKTLRGPLLVLAGAGTGKTRVITYRVAELIQRGTDPTRILAVTFTNKAAREMRERVGKLLKKRVKTRPEVSTFHSLCVRILRRQIRHLGYPPNFSIYDRGDQESLARSALREVHVSSQKLRPGDFLAIVSNWKSQTLRPDDVMGKTTNEKEELAALAYGKYEAALRGSGALDFDDLLLCTEELFERVPKARRAEAKRFDHLLIDEYQDTNALQYRIVKHLALGHRNLCVVGDDDQSIYGWRGAEVTHILNFKKDWPEATVVRLEDNYRSRASILEIANELISCNKLRHDKKLRASREGGDRPRVFKLADELEEATTVVKEIFERTRSTGPDRANPGEFAILFRTNEQPRALELELRRARLPYVLVGGQSFYDRKEIRDVLAYLKVIAKPEDEVSLLRVINTPARGIGAASIKALLDRAVEAGSPLWTQLPHAHSVPGVGDTVATRIQSFVRMINDYARCVETEPMAEVAKHLLDAVGYKDELDRIYKNPGDVEARWASIEELINSLALYERRTSKPTLLGFLEESALTGRDDLSEATDKMSPHAVKLMTFHSAKGLEFPHVYMVGMEEDILPHQRSVADTGNAGIAEERRLCYVGVTRAMDSLTLTFARARMKWGKARPSLPSRFLMEMRGEHDRAAMIAQAAAARLEEAASVPAPNQKKGTKKKSTKSTSRSTDGKRALPKKPPTASARPNGQVSTVTDKPPAKAEPRPRSTAPEKKPSGKPTATRGSGNTKSNGTQAKSAKSTSSNGAKKPQQKPTLAKKRPSAKKTAPNGTKATARKKTAAKKKASGKKPVPRRSAHPR